MAPAPAYTAACDMNDKALRELCYSHPVSEEMEGKFPALSLLCSGRPWAAAVMKVLCGCEWIYCCTSRTYLVCLGFFNLEITGLSRHRFIAFTLETVSNHKNGFAAHSLC